MHGLRVYFDRVDSQWRIKGYEEHRFSTEEDAQTACDFAAEFAVEHSVNTALERLGGCVDVGMTPKEPS